MSAAATTARPVASRRNGLLLVGLALAVVAGGLAVPQLTPDAGDARAARAAADGRDSAAAAGDLSYTPPAWPAAPDPRMMLLRLGLGTVVVLCLCVITLWAGKRWLPGAAPGTKGGTHLGLVETFALGNGCRLHLVRVASNWVLVGADANGLKAIVPVPEPFDAALDAYGGKPEARAPNPETSPNSESPMSEVGSNGFGHSGLGF